MRIAERVFQAIVFVVAGFMVLGGGFFWRQALAGDVTESQTYTLYKSLPPPPAGPRFCPVVDRGSYGLVLPCDYKPPFVWWLQHRGLERKTD
jgi:hypothetical protein